MTEELNKIFTTTGDHMDKSIEHLTLELRNIRAGKANPSMLDSVKIDYYGTETPLSQVANINTPDARTLSVQPWEKNLLDDVATAITYANLGLNPQNNGEMIIITVPVLTEERRIELCKKARAEGENAKVSIRNVRKEAMDEIKTLQKNGMGEDMAKTAESKVEGIVKSYGEKIDSIISFKEKDIMSV
ncbi:MAG: ribosome recycling factor [Flavobacteriales bacterium]|nr:ribosome recycling factor [Flavobacteriales bacterium]